MPAGCEYRILLKARDALDKLLSELSPDLER